MGWQMKSKRGPRGPYGQSISMQVFDDCVHMMLWDYPTIPALTKELKLNERKVKVIRRAIARLIAQGRCEQVSQDCGNIPAIYRSID